MVSFNNDADQDQGYVDETMSLKTQYELLKSRSLAERVIDELRLDQSKHRRGRSRRRRCAAGARRQASAGEPATAPRATISTGSFPAIARSPTRPPGTAKCWAATTVVSSFLKSLTVEPVRNSRLIKLHVDNTNPELAARIANATVQAYIAMGLERRMEASSYAKNFLEDQIKQIKAKLEESERKLNRYAQDKQILTLDEKTSVINQTYTDYATALSQAEQERIKVEAAATRRSSATPTTWPPSSRTRPCSPTRSSAPSCRSSTSRTCASTSPTFRRCCRSRRRSPRSSRRSSRRSPPSRPGCSRNTSRPRSRKR